MNSRRGEALTIVLIVIALIGGGVWLAKPKFLHGDSRRAADSKATTSALVATASAQGAAAAASVAKIGEANAAAPASAAKEFIGREVPVALSRLPSPDPLELLEAEKRRAAVMEGRLDEARTRYEAAAKTSARLQTERDEALAAKHAADSALADAAAARLAAERQAALFIAACVLLALGLAYVKFFSITPASLGLAAAGIRAGEEPIAALSRVTAPWIHARVHRAAQLATDIDAKSGK